MNILKFNQGISNPFKANSLSFVNKNFYLIRRPRRKPTLYDQERVAYKKLLHEYRLKNIATYWERQTQVENTFIENYNKEQEEKKLRDMMKFRTSIVKISYSLKRNLASHESLDKERNAALQKWYQEEQNKKANRLRIIKLLNLESQDWFNEENLEQKMKDKVLIPDFIYDQSDYYLKLQEQTMFLENADFDKLEESINEKKFIKYKNQRLIPMFGDIVSIIKHLKNIEEAKINKEFNVAKSVLAKQLGGLKNKVYEEKVKVLEQAYDTLVAKFREVSSQTQHRLELLERNLILLYNLLRKWEEYMTTMKLSNSLVESLLNEEQREQIDFLSPESVLEKKQTYTDALLSTAERHTSDSEEEIDLSKSGSASPNADLKQKVNEFMKTNAGQEMNLEEDKDSDAYKKVDEIFNSIASNKEEEKLLEERFDEITLKSGSAQSLYGYETNQADDVVDFLKLPNIEELFPKAELEAIQDFSIPKLAFPTLEQIFHDEKVNELKRGKENPKLLNSSAMVEIYKSELATLESKAGLSKKEKSKIQQLSTLLNYIAEINIDEPKMLLKIWEVYTPSYVKRVV